MLPDLLVIGDSHSDALADGCAAHGLRVEMLRFSGNIWHSGQVVFHAQHGIWVRGLPGMQKQVLALRERLGGRSVISADVPVLAAMGYHMGRIVPPFSANGHVTDAADFAADAGSAYVSRAMVGAYVDAFRANHVRLARRMSRHGNMTLVAPPHAFARRNFPAFAEALTGRMRAAGVRVFDPAPELCPPGAPLDADYLLPDGVHGNARYGAAVIGLLLQRGLIRAPGCAA
ncbi:hypothetical protein RNZ50_03870 [Paracoccaceae bacterium Fryx2]|nr:hypothetical protein [Paracoccaceae bacterium Fryx2]